MAAAKIIIQGTGLGEELDNYYSNIIEERFSEVAVYSKEKYLNSNTTHLIVGRPNSSEKLLSSLASGGRQWILRHNFLQHSFAAGRFLHEESYQYKEYKSTGSYFGTKKSREAMGRRFQNKAVVLLIPDSYVKSKIQRVIVNGGGKVLALTISHLLNSLNEEISYIITDPTRYEGEANYSCYSRLLAEYRNRVLFVCPSFIESYLTLKNFPKLEKFNINRPEINAFLVEQKNIELRRVPTKSKREGTPPLLPRLELPKKRKAPNKPLEIEIPSPAFEPVKNPDTPPLETPPPDIPRLPDTSRFPDTPDPPDAPGLPDTLGLPDTPGLPDTLGLPDTPVTPGLPDASLSSQLTAMMMEKRPEQSAFDRMIINAISTVKARQEAKKIEQQEKSRILKEYLMSGLSEDTVVPLEKRKKLEHDKRIEATKVTRVTPEYSAMETDFKHLEKPKPSLKPEKKAGKKIVRSEEFNSYMERLRKQYFFTESSFEEVHRRHQAKDAKVTEYPELPRRRRDSSTSSETRSREKRTPVKLAREENIPVKQAREGKTPVKKEREKKAPVKQEIIIDLVSEDDDDDVVVLGEGPDAAKELLVDALKEEF